MKKNGIVIFLTIIALFISYPSSALAVMQSLNGQTGQNQAFINDSNITISSNGNNHSLGWNGLLPVSRGGTGASSFTNGSIPFISNGTFAESDSFFWDPSIPRLGLGVNLELFQGNDIVFDDPSNQSEPGNILFKQGGNELIRIGWDTNERALYYTLFYSPSGSPIGIDGETGNITIGKAERFWRPDATLQIAATQSSTLLIGDIGNNQGETQQSGCLVMGDSDGDGVTYVTVNDGVLTASTSKPSVCQ